MLCVGIGTLCPTPPPVTLTASTICSQHCFPDCVLLAGKEGELLLNPYRKLCRLYSTMRDPGSVFKMHKIPAAQKPVHIHFPHVLRLCGQDPTLLACPGLSWRRCSSSPSSQPTSFPHQPSPTSTATMHSLTSPQLSRSL